MSVLKCHRMVRVCIRALLACVMGFLIMRQLTFAYYVSVDVDLVTVSELGFLMVEGAQLTL